MNSSIIGISLLSKLAECLFRSYSYLWDINFINKSDIKTIVNDIINRHRTILIILKMLILTSKQSKKLASELLGLIHNILSEPAIKNLNLNVVGCETYINYFKDLVWETFWIDFINYFNSRQTISARLMEKIDFSLQFFSPNTIWKWFWF